MPGLLHLRDRPASRPLRAPEPIAASCVRHVRRDLPLAPVNQLLDLRHERVNQPRPARPRQRIRAAAGRAAAHGGGLQVVCARARTRRLFRLTGLDRAVGLAGTVGEALQKLAAGPDTRARAAQDSRAGRLARAGSC